MVFATLAFLDAFSADQSLLTYFADLSGPGLLYGAAAPSQQQSWYGHCQHLIVPWEASPKLGPGFSPGVAYLMICLLLTAMLGLRASCARGRNPCRGYFSDVIDP